LEAVGSPKAAERSENRFGGLSADRRSRRERKTLARPTGVHLIDIILDKADKAAWLARRHG
jgi:hypothetical protein